MRNKLPTLILLAFLPLFLTACTLSDLPVVGKYFKKAPKNVTLSVWGLWEDPAIMTMLIEKYQEANPEVTIEYDDRSVMELVTYKERVFERAQQATGPDVVLAHNSWIPSLSASLAPAPDKLMDANTFQSTFYPVAAASAVSGGKVYGVPLYYDGLVLVYNKDHFAEIEQDQPPTAWEEFRRLALELTVRSGEDNSGIVRAGAALGAADNVTHFSDILGLMWSQAGVNIPQDLETKAAQDAMTFYKNFLTEDRVWSGAFPEATVAFVNGQVSMLFVPSWQILDILKAAPEINIGVAPVPQALPDTPAAWSSFWMEVVPANSENADVAWDFITFLVAEEQQLLLFSEASKVRPFGAPYSRVSLSSEIAANPYIGPVITTAAYAKSAEIAARAGNRRQVTALQDAVNAILSGTSVETALSTAKGVISQ